MEFQIQTKSCCEYVSRSAADCLLFLASISLYKENPVLKIGKVHNFAQTILVLCKIFLT